MIVLSPSGRSKAISNLDIIFDVNVPPKHILENKIRAKTQFAVDSDWSIH